MIDDGYLNLLSHDSFAQGVPHKTFERLRHSDPVSWTEGDSDTKGFWNLTRHADISLANRENKIFSSAQGMVRYLSYFRYLSNNRSHLESKNHTQSLGLNQGLNSCCSYHVE